MLRAEGVAVRVLYCDNACRDTGLTRDFHSYITNAWQWRNQYVGRDPPRPVDIMCIKLSHTVRKYLCK